MECEEKMMMKVKPEFGGFVYDKRFDDNRQSLNQAQIVALLPIYDLVTNSLVVDYVAQEDEETLKTNLDHAVSKSRRPKKRLPLFFYHFLSFFIGRHLTSTSFLLVSNL